MKLRHQKLFKKPLGQIFANGMQACEKEQESFDDKLVFLADLVNLYRPKNPKQVYEVSILSLLDFLKNNPEQAQFFKEVFAEMLIGKSFRTILSEAGIIQDSNFKKEMKKRLIASFIPFQPSKDSLEFTLNQIFYLRKDLYWVKRIPANELVELFHLLELKDIYHSVDRRTPLDELMTSIRLLLQRMSGRALEADVIQMLPEYENLESPFEQLEKEFELLENQIRTSSRHCVQENNLDLKQFGVLLKQCETFIDRAYSNSSKFGITIQVNQNLLRIKQQLSRVKKLIAYFKAKDQEDKVKKSLHLSLKLIENNCKKNDIKKLFNESTQLIAYEITQHSAKTGEHYITSGRKTYFKMLYSALLGGAVVGCMCITKLLLGKLHLSDFGHALLYSLNYSVGFIIIYLIGATLATKQPAMTAATMVKSLLEGKDETDIYQRYRHFAEFFARLMRSQFIAFVGNIVMAFPVALLLVYGIDYLFDINIAAAKSKKLILDNSPIHTRAIFHASIAGIFLFLSGVISGSISNSNKHNRLYYRLEEHPILKITLGRNRTKRIAHWFEKKWAGVASNFWFGIFMGSTGSIGIFLGLDWDIRHITFASGNLALGLFGMDFRIHGDLLFWATFGIIVIGFFNFIVSFFLSLFLAFRSRNIPLSELKLIFYVVWLQFKIDPISFIYPSKRYRTSTPREISLEEEALDN